MLKAVIVRACVAWGVLLSLPVSAQQSSAEQVFQAIESSVYQIQIIENHSASQVALGTGFLVEGGIATNYHVVSNVVLEPEKHKAQILIEDKIYGLAVRSVDVVNDLALLTSEEPLPGAPFKLAQTPAGQGSILYSLGNPHNIGMTVVQGNYNGLAEHSFFERIHFSGAVNSGMSGGPTVNNNAEVVGINVASAGNQIGFLVPVKFLEQLLEHAQTLDEGFNLLEHMAKQIAQTSDDMVAAILATQWPSEPMGKATILGKTVDWMECWGDSETDDETQVMEIARGCSSGDNIYVSHLLTTGYFEYEFFYKETPDWPTSAFYRHWRGDTASAVPGNRASKTHVGNYECTDTQVTTHKATPQQMRRRASYCVRPYKKLPGLYDVFFIGVTNDQNKYGVMDHFTLSGVTEASAQAFLARFVEVMAWQ